MYIGLAKVFDWGERPNRKSQVMASSKFFEKRTFTKQKYRKMEDQKPGPGLAFNLGFTTEKGLELKVKKISKIV